MMAVGPGQTDAADAAHVEAMAVVLELDRVLLQVACELEANDIDFRVLKGAANAHLVYADPSLRAYGDVDLIIEQKRYSDAVCVLARAGFGRRTKEIREGFDAKFGKGTTLVGPHGHEVDLHRTLAFGPFGLSIVVDDLFSRPDTFTLGGRRLLALGPVERFVAACVHAALGDRRPRLLPMRDVAETLLSGALDLSSVHRVCDRWQTAAVVSQAIRMTWDRFELADATPLTAWARSYEPNRHEEAALALYRGDRSWGAQAVASLPFVFGLRRKMSYLTALAVTAHTHRGIARSVRRVQRVRRAA
jgi:hypothetical protein